MNIKRRKLRERLLLALGFVLIPALAHSAANNFNFSLKNDGDKTVTQGSPVTTTITATLLLGASQPVSFAVSGLPQNTTASFSLTSCTPTCSTTLTVSTLASTPTGTSTITVTGTATGGLHKKTSFSLTVATSSSFNFSLDKPHDITITQGGS